MAQSGIPLGKMLVSEPFSFEGSNYIMQNTGIGMKDSFVVYQYSMGGAGGVPLAVRRDGKWVSYLNKNYAIPVSEAAKYDEVAKTIQAKDYHE